MNLKQVVTAIVVISLTVVAAPAAAQMCGSQTTVTLFGGQTIDTGTVTIANDFANLYVTYTTTDPWVMTATHLAVADSLAGIPQNKNQNPIPGHFQYTTTFNPPVTTFTYTIPLGNFAPGETLYIAAQAEVQAPAGQGGGQTAWGSGQRFGGHNWATYITYIVQSCNE